MAALCGHVDVNTDLGDNYNVQASIGDITLRTKEKTYRPVDVLVDLYTRRDTTHAIADCGDFHLNMDVRGGYKSLLKTMDGLTTELATQMKERRIDQVRIRRQFPLGHIYLSTGKSNFISRFIEYCGYQFKSVEMDLNASPIAGLNGYLNIDSLVAQGIQLDTIRALIHLSLIHI